MYTGTPPVSWMFEMTDPTPHVEPLLLHASSALPHELYTETTVSKGACPHVSILYGPVHGGVKLNQTSL